MDITEIVYKMNNDSYYRYELNKFNYESNVDLAQVVLSNFMIGEFGTSNTILTLVSMNILTVEWLEKIIFKTHLNAKNGDKVKV